MSLGAPEGEGIENLLEPSLASDRAGQPIYSTQANFLVAFFGGAFAILIFSFANSKRLDRLNSEKWLYGILGLAATAITLLFGTWVANDTIPEWLDLLGTGPRGVRRLSQILALLIFGVFYQQHRVFHKAQSFSAQEAPSPWRMAAIALLGGTFITMAIFFIGRLLAQFTS